MRLPPLWKPGLLWLLFLGPFFFLSYGFANHWAAAQSSVPSIVFAWERHIPLIPWTIVPYWSIDLFYGLSLLICSTRLELARHARRLLTAQVICVAAFLLFPLRLSIPRAQVDGWAGPLFVALTDFDLPFNQAPSLHIVLLLILWDFYRRRLDGWAKGALHVWSALIGISVLTTYQHHFIDIPTGLLVGALCLWLWPLEGEPPTWERTVAPKRRRLALLYTGGAVLLVLLASMGRSWWWLYWPAVSLGLVALCYAFLGPGGFQKGLRGRHSLSSRLLFFPYQIGAWLNARWWTRSLPGSVLIGEGVWLGRLPLAWEADYDRFSRIVDVTSELSIQHRGVQAHGWLDLIEPTPDNLLAAARAVQQATTTGPVLVCCALGFSRSSAVVATWLCVQGHQAYVDDAVKQIRLARPQIVLKPALLRVIEQSVTLARAGASA